MCPRSRNAWHSACDSSQAISTYSLRECGRVSACALRDDFSCNVVIISDIGRNELEIRRQCYCTAFSALENAIHFVADFHFFTRNLNQESRINPRHIHVTS